ncbi:hypothetical protein MU1_43550 [Paenibacillus glycanilyticus]|uniref:Uncharacterized protein n=1 Tax=Paenibacillus glycanilyticus TaxID=126569 RepID=A0ABQ6GGD4_9BACL|nr:hypothetical protein MU1_43550 [Paenibacillus glycanilyticus]
MLKKHPMTKKRNNDYGHFIKYSVFSIIPFGPEGDYLRFRADIVFACKLVALVCSLLTITLRGSSTNDYN